MSSPSTPSSVSQSGVAIELTTYQSVSYWHGCIQGNLRTKDLLGDNIKSNNLSDVEVILLKLSIQL